MDAEATAGPSGSAVAGPSEEAGRKRLTKEIATAASTSSVTESPISRPPPDKQRADAPQPQLKSVVIARPTFLVGYLGRGAPQMSLEEAIDRYGTPDAGSAVSSVPSGTAPSADIVTPEAPVTVEEPHPPSYLPPAEDVSGSVVTSDAIRI